MRLPIRKLATSSPLTTAAAVVREVRPLFPRSQGFRERCWALLLDSSLTVIGAFKVSEGGTRKTVFDGKLICKAAVDRLAYGVILVHNHPSGTAAPSQNDVRETKEIAKMLAVLDVKMLDHVIIAEDSFYSFSDERTTETAA